MKRRKRLDERAWSNLDSSRYRKSWGTEAGFSIIAPAVRRQLRTAKTILERFKRGQRGILLADDVGLGKTTVAAIVALIYASKGRKIRVLAPNQLVAEKWEKDLETHKAVLEKVAPHLDWKTVAIRASYLRDSSIVVGTHYDASWKASIACDLLIIDEAHRSKKKDSPFRNKLVKDTESIAHILCLTATPFSINPDELTQILKLIRIDESVAKSVKQFTENLAAYWNQEGVIAAAALVAKQEQVLKSLKKFVVRHSIESLQSSEKKSYGQSTLGLNWGIEHPNETTLEILLRADRLFFLKNSYTGKHGITNDPRFHVSWEHLRDRLKQMPPANNAPEEEKQHDKKLRRLLRKKLPNPKAAKVAERIKKLICENGGPDYQEKVLVFCRHYASANEIATEIKKQFGRPRHAFDRKIWRAAWDSVIRDKDDTQKREEFLDWLSSASICAQTAAWLTDVPRDAEGLAAMLEKTCPRGCTRGKYIAQEARDLFSKIKKTTGLSRERIFLQTEAQVHPNTLEVFNSPFGPDVLVATDRLSEGIDLHFWCRHLVHYELSPSPMRSIQRRGRLRRLGNWASRSGRDLEVAYPSLPGTRDERAVEIMKHRLDLFDFMLGGVGFPNKFGR